MSRRNDDSLGCLFGFLGVFYLFKWLIDIAENMTPTEWKWFIIVSLSINLVCIVGIAIIKLSLENVP